MANKRKHMTDFVSYEEELSFRVMGPIGHPASEFPYIALDAIVICEKHNELGIDPADVAETMAILQRTFK